MTDDQLKALEGKEVCVVSSFIHGTLTAALGGHVILGPDGKEIRHVVKPLDRLEPWPVPPPEQPGLADRCKELVEKWRTEATLWKAPISTCLENRAKELEALLESFGGEK